MKKSNFFIYTFLLLLPSFTFAQIRISEIMYDPKDSDSSSGGEWIEVQNLSSETVDLTKIYFYEAETNHGITADGASEVPALGHAVISRDLTVFKNHFSNFPHSLFKATFSLNDGEKLAIKKTKEEFVSDENSVTYTSDWGAKNDGNSLQLVNGMWIAAAPTPGKANISGEEAAPAGAEETSPNQLSTQTAQTSAWKSEPQVYANAGGDKSVIVGSEVLFSGSALGVKKEPLVNARYAWNFGDGSIKDGKLVSHTYYFPGTYTVTLDVSSGEYSQGDSATIMVVDAKLKVGEVIKGVDGYISLINEGTTDTDISKFILQSGTLTFTFPPGTIIKSKNTIRFPGAVTKLSGDLPIMILYSNGSPLKTSITSAEVKSPSTVILPKLASTGQLPKNEAIKPATSLSDAETYKTQVGALADEAKTPGMALWLGLMASILGLSIAGIIYSRRNRSEADLYEIEEVKE